MKERVGGISVFFSLSQVLCWKSLRVCQSATMPSSLQRIVDRSINGMGVCPASSAAYAICL